MKNLIRKVVILVMAAALSSGFAGCVKSMLSDNEKVIKAHLQSTYDSEFEVVSVGNVLASSSMDTATAYCYPKNDPELLFEVKMKTDKSAFSDNYPIRRLEFEAKKDIEDAFAKQGITATVDVFINGYAKSIDPVNDDFDAILKQCAFQSLSFTTLMCEGADALQTYDAITAILNDFHGRNPQMALGSTLWKYDESNYAACAALLKSAPHLTLSQLQKYQPLADVNVALLDGAFNTDFAAFETAYDKK